MLEHIAIEGVRNLTALKVELAPGATALFGANGSGKTSFLEAVHLCWVQAALLEHTNQNPMIQHGMDQCRVVGRVKQPGHTLTMGIEKHRDGTVRGRVDGENTSSLSELAQHLPLILLDTDGLGVVTGPPEGRRRLLDGTLFHVEQGFLSLWKRYAQTVRQRNSGLRRGILKSDKAWRHELAETGELLTGLRARAAAQLAERLTEAGASTLADLAGLEVVFRRRLGPEPDVARGAGAQRGQ